MRANQFLTVLALGVGFTSCAKKDGKEDSQLAAITQTVTSSSQLPACSAESISQVYWVEETAKLVVCDGTEFVEIKGEKGEQGEAGNTGSAGSAANSGVWVFDADAKPVGVLMGASSGLILFANGAIARMNLATGSYLVPVALGPSGNIVDGVGDTFANCNYVATDCSGTCYQVANTNLTPIKGSIYKSGTSYFVATGKEDLVSGLTANSGLLANGTCYDFVANSATYSMNSYPITRPYAFPEGITLPLKTPLTFGMKTEQ